MGGVDLVLDLCQRAIRKQGFARSNVIAGELDMRIADVETRLRPAVERGDLVTCDLTLGEDQIRATEYRASTVAGGKLLAHSPIGRTPVKPDPVKARLKEWGTPRTRPAAEPLAGTERPERRGTDEQHRRNDHAAPTAAHAAEPKGEPKMSTREKIAAALKAHGPMLFSALKKRVDASEGAISVALSNGRETDPPLFAKLGGGPRSTIWGLPGQKIPAPKALDTQRRKAAGGAAAMRNKHGRKGRVKRTSAIPVKARGSRRPFQVVLCSDGALLFLNATSGDLDLSRDECRGLVKAVRHLEAVELGEVFDFVRRLDKAEVAA